MSVSSGMASFFRQGSWMVVATVGSGVFMSAVHVVAASMAKAEYGVFFTLLRVFLLMGIPALGLQTVFAQQAAAAHTETQDRELAQTTRSVLRVTFLVWLGMAAAAAASSQVLLRQLKIGNPMALWLTVGLGLSALWLPVLKGLLQGRQAFTGLGGVMILDGVGRFLAVAVIVLGLGGQAAGGLLGALVGQWLAILVAAWLTRHWWRGAGAPFLWRPWLRRVVPLTLGPGAVLVMCNADILMVQAVFPEQQTPYYMAGAMVGFALVQFATPLAAVMFPKLVRSRARAERSDAMQWTLISTFAMGALAAIGSTLLPELPLRVLYFRNPDFVQAAPLVPWFAWAMLMVTLANVLINNLLAAGRYRVVPWLALLAGAYVAALLGCRGYLAQLETAAAFGAVVRILTGFSALLFAMVAWFTWGCPRAASDHRSDELPALPRG